MSFNSSLLKRAADKRLVEILEDMDNQAFVQWVESNWDTELKGYASELKDLPEEDVPLYTRMIINCAPQLAKLLLPTEDGDYVLPSPIDPDKLDQLWYNYQLPIELFKHMPEPVALAAACLNGDVRKDVCAFLKPKLKGRAAELLSLTGFSMEAFAMRKLIAQDALLEIFDRDELKRWAESVRGKQDLHTTWTTQAYLFCKNL